MHLLPANGLCVAALLVMTTAAAFVLPQLHLQLTEMPSATRFVEFTALIVLTLIVLASAALYWRRRRAARRITLTLR